MERTVNLEVTKKEAKSFEKILDKNLNVLRRLEKESPEREIRIAQTQSETQKIKKEIQKQLSILKQRTSRPNTEI